MADIESMQCDMYVDITGLDCSAPFSKLTEAVEALSAGKTLLAIAKKSNLQSDIPEYCRQMQLELMEQGEDNEQYYFLIRR